MAGSGYRVFDNVHGFISLTEVEKELVYSQPFGRLRYIRQMGLAPLVFPGAEHTRFSHCLGVMHIVSELTRDLLDPHGKQLVKVAALLHDIGHFPLSHAIEDVLAQDLRETRETAANDATILSNPPDAAECLPDLSSAEVRAEERLHESFTKELIVRSEIRKILECASLNPETVAAVCTGLDLDQLDPSASEAQISLARVLKQMLHSQLDADRLDYLMRDTKFTGLEAGGFDLQKLCKEAAWDGDKFGFEIHGLRAVEQFVFSRLVNYRQIVLNKHVQAFEHMAREVYRYAMNLQLAHTYQAVLEMIGSDGGRLAEWNDHSFFALCHRVAERKDSDPAVELAGLLVRNRSLYRVWTDELLGTDDDWRAFSETSAIVRFQHEQQDIAGKTGVSESHLHVVETEPLSIVKPAGQQPIYIRNHGTFCDVVNLPQSTLGAFAGKKLFLRRLYAHSKDEGERLHDVLVTLTS